MLKIQNVIFNDEIYPANRNLYYTLSEQLESMVLSFGTYFNSLWLQDWKEYTDISGLYLHVQFRGEGTVSIIQSRLIDEEVSHIVLHKEKIASSGVEYNQIKLPEADSACRMIHFEIEYDKNRDFEFLDAYYAARSSSLPRPVKTAIVICTYKRERYLNHNIATLKNYFAKNPTLAEIYDVFIVDNGKTLPTDIEEKNIFLFSNKNTGGSGGFARGILEALRSTTEYTHVLLMDDDIEINTEALQRTYALTSLVRDEYRQAFISGSMLRSDLKDFQWEARARIKGLLLDIYGTMSLSNFPNLLRNEAMSTKHTNRDYAAWWYCCIPLKNIGLNSLPFPFFIRGDDIDYSLKYADKIIHLNGICVWHEPFDSRRSNVMDIYMAVRNFMTINIIHRINPLASIFDLVKIFAGNIFTYNYGGAELVCHGLEDAISEKEIFRENQLDLLTGYKHCNEVEREVNVDLEKAHRKTRLNFPMKIVALLSCGGHLLPGFLFRNESVSTNGYLIGISKCLLRKQITIYNPVTGKSIIRKIDRIKAMKLSFRFTSLLLRFFFNSSKIVRRIREREHHYRTIEFWKDYLEID